MQADIQLMRLIVQIYIRSKPTTDLSGLEDSADWYAQS